MAAEQTTGVRIFRLDKPGNFGTGYTREAVEKLIADGSPVPMDAIAGAPRDTRNLRIEGDYLICDIPITMLVPETGEAGG